MNRSGIGYDVHKLDKDRKLILGGVDIPSDLGLLGHSDADCLIHAIMDAILGSVSLGDIGQHFPDSSDDYKDISSIYLLQKVNELLKENNCSIINIDSVIIMQKPKVAKYIDEMRKNISNALNIDLDMISIKATTEEYLGFTGDSLGVKCLATCIVDKK